MVVDRLLSYIFPPEYQYLLYFYINIPKTTLNISYIIPPKFQYLLYCFLQFQILYFVWGPIHPLQIPFFHNPISRKSLFPEILFFQNSISPRTQFPKIPISLPRDTKSWKDRWTARLLWRFIGFLYFFKISVEILFVSDF